MRLELSVLHMDTSDTPSVRRQLSSPLWEARNQILLGYAGFLLLAGLMGIPIFKGLFFARIDSRVRVDLREELQNFEDALQEWQGQEQAPLNTSDLLQTFIEEQRPEDDNFLIAYLEGEFLSSNPRTLLPQFNQSSKLLRLLSQSDTASRGEFSTSYPEVGTLIYKTYPFTLGSQSGVFITLHATAGERREALDGVWTFTQILTVGVFVALLLAWIVSGIVLAPLQTLSQATQSIDDPDPSHRIPIRGYGQLAELAITFNAMMERLQIVFAGQRDFISDAGHELRTPITIIQGHLELMGDDPEEQQETLSLVLDELDRMGRIVNDMSLLARSERPDFLQPGLIEIDKFIQELATKASTLAPRNWQLDYSPTPSVLKADRQRLTQAMMNLLRNAVQHTQSGDTITIGFATTAEHTMLWVEDTGEGIAPDDQGRIFQRFVRGSQRSRPSDGAGLGLPIVGAIAEAHGGSVELKSQLGHGSRFTIIMPLELCQARMAA